MTIFLTVAGCLAVVTASIMAIMGASLTEAFTGFPGKEDE